MSIQIISIQLSPTLKMTEKKNHIDPKKLILSSSSRIHEMRSCFLQNLNY